MMNWIKHAFAIEHEDIVVPTDSQRKVVDKVCDEIVKRHLTAPALLFLEVFRPMNYVGSQVLHFLYPIVSSILRNDNLKQFTEFLEQRKSIDYLCSRIEQLEDKNSVTKNKQSINT